jgi:hypothetical protein
VPYIKALLEIQFNLLDNPAHFVKQKRGGGSKKNVIFFLFYAGNKNEKLAIALHPKKKRL